MPYTVGLDFGTNSVRALIVDCRDGREVGSSLCWYPSGEKGILLDSSEHALARQHPLDYGYSMDRAVREALDAARAVVENFTVSDVIGIGVDATGSSPLPVDGKNRSLAEQECYRDRLSAQCWLWKDHTATEEAERITRLVERENPAFLARCGGVYSPEWWWAKIWHCLRTDSEVFHAAASWVELCDWIPSVLCGVESPQDIRRCVGCAGHKALYDTDWGGLPGPAFFQALAPELIPLRNSLYQEIYTAADPAGFLCPDWAERLGLLEGTPVAVGGIDVYYGAIGAGVKPGTLVKIIGTSACDCTVVPGNREVRAVPGICGLVRDSVLPGNWGLEAGQCAVGDIFAWWVDRICGGGGGVHESLTAEASAMLPGESGLLALDWHNGNRNILVDSCLTGLLLGQTLQTSPAEIYRALIEATAFGARMILERIREYGISVESVVCAGGIATRNSLLMQIFSDVLEMPLQVSRSRETCALGSAVTATVAAGLERGGYASFPEAQCRMTGLSNIVYHPGKGRAAVYARLFQLYRKLHDNFGAVHPTTLDGLMKDLLNLKSEARLLASSENQAVPPA